jgi:CRISPR/Cas system-associated exonuclease Cas4 (RecB family)
MRAMVTLVILLAFAAIGFGAYQAINDTATRRIELNERVRGNVQQAVDEVKKLIEENTR